MENQEFKNGLFELIGNTDLADLTPEKVFQKGGSHVLLNAIKQKAEEFVPNLDTDKGRKEIASFARKIASSKVFLDDARKKLVQDEKRRLVLIDDEGKYIRDFLDSLKEEVRKPLTLWEQEQARLQ